MPKSLTSIEFMVHILYEKYMPVTHSHKRPSFFSDVRYGKFFTNGYIIKRYDRVQVSSGEPELSAGKKRFQKCCVVLELHSKYCGNALTWLSEALKKSYFHNLDKSRR